MKRQDELNGKENVCFWFRYALLKPETTLVFICVIGLIFRVVHSLNGHCFMDELYSFRWVTQLFLHKQIPTGNAYILYPALYSMIIAIPTGVWALLLSFTGKINNPSDFSGLAKVEIETCLMPGRFVNILIYMLTVMVIFRILKRLAGKWPACFAVASIAFSFVHVARSSTAQPDVLGVLFVALCVLFSLNALDSETTLPFIYASCFAGLAAATKYFPGVIILVVVLAHIMLLKKEGRLLQITGWLDPRIIFSGMAALGCFLIASPIWLADPSQWWHGISRLFAFLPEGKIGTYGADYIGYFPRMWHSETTLLLFFLAGFFYCAFSKNRKHRLLFFTVLLLFVYLGRSTVKQPHYLLILYPALALMGAVFIEAVSKAFNKKISLILTIILFFSFFSMPVYKACYAAQKVVRYKDNRILSLAWIQKNIEENAVIASDWAYVPELMTQEFKKEMLNGRNGAFFKDYYSKNPLHKRVYKKEALIPSLKKIQKLQSDYIVLSSGCYRRFFQGTPPPEGNPKREVFNLSKEAYTLLLNSPETLGWQLLRDFSFGRGPHITILKRGRLPR